MKKIAICLIGLGFGLVGCDSDDSKPQCSPECTSEQTCIDGSCQPAQNQPTEIDDGKPTDNPPVDNPPVDNPPTDNPPVDNPPVDNPPTDNPPVDNPPTDNPPVDNPPTDNPPTDNPPVDNPPTDNPPTDNPPEGNTQTCGTKTCTIEQLCLNNQCVDRNNKAVKGVTCDPKVFIESCDNNNLVHCECDEETKECKTAVSECNKLTCALMVKANYGMCAKADEKCKAEGELTMCYDIENGFTSYIEYLDCTLATDGKYYPFRTDIKDVDCIGTCLDKYSCNLGEEKCDANFKDYCDGEIATYCSEGIVYQMNCADYGATCSIKDDGSLCDYGG